MTVSDNLGDMLTQVKNAYMAGKHHIVIPFSKEKENALKVLVKNKIVVESVVTEEDGVKRLSVTVPERTKELIIKRMSKPGRRMYIKTKELYTVKGGRGFLIVSTPQGIMDSKEAKAKKLGGELIAEVF